MIITHPEYNQNLAIWKLCRDVNTPKAVKDKGRTYLPFVGDETSDDDIARYNNYLKRAMFYGYFAETVAGLSGMAFRDGVEIDAAGNEYIETDLDGSGVGLQQSMQASVNDDLVFGRFGLLVDYPQTEGVATIAEQEQLSLRATITKYDALEIRNWHTTKIGGAVVVSLVSLAETAEKVGEDGLTIERVEQERRLMLDESGLYRVEVYQDSDEPVEVYEPKNSSGARLNYIPFYFGGSMNNDATVDDAPLYSVADLNIGHYRNSADYENSVFLLQPQPWSTGLTQDWVDKNLKGFKLGSGRLMGLPEGAAFGIAQPEPNQQAFEAMNHKQEQMIALGAKLITNDGQLKTATQAVMNNTSQTSKLAQIIGNVEIAYNMALEALADMNGTQAPVVVFNVDLNKIAIDAAVARIVVDAFMSGLIAKQDARQYLRSKDVIERTDEEIDADIEGDAGLNLDE